MADNRFPHMKEVKAHEQDGEAYFAPVSVAEKYARGARNFLESESKTLFPGDEEKQDEWQGRAGELLYKFKVRDGILVHSTPHTNTAFTMFVPEHPLLDMQTYTEMRDYAVDQGKSRVVLGPIYTDLSMNLSGKPQRNETEARALLKSMAEHGISTKNARAPRLGQLVLVGDKDAGLVWALKDNVPDKDVANTRDFVPESYIGNNGLFRGSVGNDGFIYANYGYLRNSNDYGRVACYAPKGASPATTSETAIRKSMAERLEIDFLSSIQKGS
jgi:hypothetical protein